MNHEVCVQPTRGERIMKLLKPVCIGCAAMLAVPAPIRGESSAEFVGESHVAVAREVGIPAENREETMRRLATPEKSKQRRGIILRPIEYNASSLFTFFPEEAGLSKARDVCRLDADRSHFTHKFC